MTPSCSWIVCERGGCWTPALRTAFGRNAAPMRYRLHEVRRLAELEAALAERPGSLVAVEVHQANFAEALAWLASAAQRDPEACPVALVDRALATSAAIDALREAGALDIATSPRRLRPLLEFGQRHAAAMAELAALSSDGDTLSLTARAWAALPWQDA